MHGDSCGDSSEFIHQDVGSLFLTIFAHTIYTFLGGGAEGPSFIIYINDLLWSVSITYGGGEVTKYRVQKKILLIYLKE